MGGNGDVHEANLEDSAHRDDAVYGVVDGVRYKVEMEEIGTWDTPLKSDDMDSMMTQRFCRSTIRRGDSVETGYAVNELCFGTLR
mgnify:FL=1